MASSNQYTFSPSLADLTVEAFSRIQLRGPAITIEHMVEARRSINLLLQQFSNRGVNQWAITPDGLPDIQIALQPGIAGYQLPPNTVSLLDCYLRTYTPGTATVNLGAALTAVVGQSGAPVIGSPYGDPIVGQPGNGSLSCTAGSQIATLAWPSHGLTTGAPLFWGCPVSIGGLSVSGFSLVSAVIDPDVLQFELPIPALESQTNAGGTPLFYTQNGSSTVTVILPRHGLSAGHGVDDFTVQIPTTVGGLMLSGTYDVAAVQSPYRFTFTAPGPASATAVAFENGGQINVTSQATGADPVDIYLSPLSRNEYAMLPDKFVTGRPTQFWFNRAINPTIQMWPVPDTAVFYGFVAYRMRELQDANPQGGQTPDVPRRFLEALTAAITAKLAEKFKPTLFKEKLLLAQAAWEEAAEEDREKVSSVFRITGYF